VCGICGIYNFDKSNINLENLTNINNNLYKRGPDSGGIYANKFIGLGNRRLKIIDFEGGDQPFYSEDKNLVLVFNGEIFNYVELKEDLKKKGFNFKTNSDTEVILIMYQAYGNKMLEKINGMFAFSIWDHKQEKLLIARDRIGIKPLYYSLKNNQIIFSSTLNSILKTQKNKKDIDIESILYYSFLGYIPAPKTIWKNFHKLEPGHYIEIKNNKFNINKYWNLEIKINENITNKNKNIYFDELKDLILDSNKIQSRSDAKIGVFLSGGLDSTLITKIFSKNYEKQFNTYTVDFEGKKNLEINNVKKLLENTEININYHFLKFNENKNIYKNVLNAFDEPNSDSASIPSYLLALKSKNNLDKVILNGCGGDEIFGGYDRYYINKKFIFGSFLNFIKKKIFKKRNIFEFNSDLLHYEIKLTEPVMRFVTNSSGTNLGFLKRILKKNLFTDGCNLINRKFESYDKNYKKFGPTYAGMLQDLKYYVPDNLLYIADQTSMDNSVEVRVPFLDHRIIEKIFSFPQDLIVGKNFKDSKVLLKKIFKYLIPSNIFKQKKSGFNVLSNKWVENDFEYFKKHILNTKSQELEEIIDYRELEKIFLKKKLSKKYYNDIFMIYTLIKWFDIHGKN
jgi:asparagine synthase (glutamine-hydrolysing)